MAEVLGKLERIDLRTAWTEEAEDFTPWLAREGNIALLGDTVGMELEVEGTEQSVGSFSADILCKDIGRDTWVVIENQLERTDHSHLGQILTYAAGLDATTMIWVARRFTDEHRAAVDWLNYISGEDFQFFGLEVELWRIGDSAPAPKFNIVSAPNDWSKTVAETARSAESNERARSYREYWLSLTDRYADESPLFRPGKTSRSNWKGFGIGRSNFYLSASMRRREQALRVSIEIGSSNSEAFYRLLEANRPAIEEELGFKAVWDDRPNRMYKYIYVQRLNVDTEDRSDWPNQHAWLRDKLEIFHKVFAPRIKTLDASEWVPTKQSGVV